MSMFKNDEDRSKDVLLMGIRTPVFTLLAFVVQICMLTVVEKVVRRTLEVGVSSRCWGRYSDIFRPLCCTSIEN